MGTHQKLSSEDDDTEKREISKLSSESDSEKKRRVDSSLKNSAWCEIGSSILNIYSLTL